MKIGEFTLVNADKVTRAIEGTPQRAGTPVGGVGKDAPDEVKIAAYDKLAGLILKGRRKVKTGSFWDFENNKAFDEPHVVYEVRGVDGKVYEIADGEEAPLEVQVAEKQESEAEEEDESKVKKTTVKKTTRKRSKKSVEDEE